MSNLLIKIALILLIALIVWECIELGFTFFKFRKDLRDLKIVLLSQSKYKAWRFKAAMMLTRHVSDTSLKGVLLYLIIKHYYNG